jgi:hypothetical protein
MAHRSLALIATLVIVGTALGGPGPLRAEPAAPGDRRAQRGGRDENFFWHGSHVVS